MNIVIDFNNVNLINAFLLETKRNIIMCGNFTKIMYSNELLTMNGLYLTFPIDNSIMEKISNKKQIRFNPHSLKNSQLVQEFSKIEFKLLEYYRFYKNCNCKFSNILSKQLNSGILKVQNEYNSQLTDYINQNSYFILKISGIWETEEDIGLTFKVIEVGENYL